MAVPWALAAMLAAGCGSTSSGSSGHTISGTVTGEASVGVTVTLTGPSVNTATTDAAGAYAFRNIGDNGYVVTAALAGYTFTPHAGRQLVVAGADVGGQDFVATGTHHAIRGAVSGVVTGGVPIVLSGAASATTTTAADGTYGFASVDDGTYLVAPSLAGHGFTPGARSVTLAGADAVGQDFVSSVSTSATHAISGAISGTVKAGVVMALQAGAAPPVTATSDASGAYAFAGIPDGAYTLTPALAGSAFTPRSRAVTLNGADAPGQDFTAAASAAAAAQVGELATGGHLAHGIAIGNDLNAWITDPVNGVVSRVLLQDSTVGARGDVLDLALTPAGAQPTAIALRFFGRRCFTETAANTIGCASFDGAEVFTVNIPTAASGAVDIVNGPGADQLHPDMWFAERDAGKVGRMSITEGPTSGSGTVVAEYALPAGCKPTALVTAVDGNIWWAAGGCNRIGWVDRTSGAVHVVPVEVGQPVSLAPNLGETAVWFVDAASDRLGRLTATGGLSWFSPPAPGSKLTSVALGPDLALYVTELAGNAIARFPLASFDPNAPPSSGHLTEELALPTAASQPFLITSGVDGNLWFTERGQPKIGGIFMATHCIFGKVTLADGVTPLPLASTLTLTQAGGAPRLATSDAAGDYSFCGLPPGSYTVTPSQAGRTFAPASLPVTMALSNLIDRSFVAQ